MDHHSTLEQEVRVDLESVKVVINADKEGTIDHGSVDNSCDHFMSVDDHLVKLGVNSLTVDVGSQDKRKKASSAKKPPKHPRPHRGFSLDAADQKLIKELAELAMIKRARIERMKALMQKKTSKVSSHPSSSSSSNGSLYAMLFTIIFFLVIFFQGMLCPNSHGTFKGSPEAAQTNEIGLISIHGQLNPYGRGSI